MPPHVPGSSPASAGVSFFWMPWAAQPAIAQAQLPPPFLQLGMQTHRAFDALADQLKAGASGQEALKAIAQRTGNCVACHATYRLDEAR